MDAKEIKTEVIKPIECFKEGWQLIKPNYLLLFAITIVGIMLGGVSLYILTGALICGITKCYLQAIDGEEIEFEQLYKNLKQYFLPGLFVLALIIVPMLFVFSFVTLPAIIQLSTDNSLTAEQLQTLFIVTISIEFVIAFIMVCLHTLLMFAFPLIADKNLSGWEATKKSAKAVWQNRNGVAGLWAVGFGISLIGLLLFCVGIYLTIPIMIAGNTVAYRKIFPKEI